MAVPPDLILTQDLLHRAKTGDQDALGALMARYRPRLERWASGRLPGYARSLLDTGDLVQEALMKALEKLDQFEIRGPGMFQAYIRQAILNRIRDQVRWSRRRPGTNVPEHVEDRAPSPLDSAVVMNLMERYERSLAQLSEDEQQLIHLRIELDFGYAEIGAMTDRSAAAARMAAQRALRKLGEIMGRER